jgi:multisubunit Na+/H+ antiporter MnhB subunit
MSMGDKPPFDPIKASFYLVSGILAFQCLMVGAVAIICMSLAFNEVIQGKFECDKGGKLSELMTGALAAALAFAGGTTRGRDK